MLSHAFPAGLRERHGEDMAQLFADRCREARVGVSTTRGTLRVAGLWVAALRDAAVHGLLARVGLGSSPRGARGRGHERRYGHLPIERETVFAVLTHDLRHAARSLVAARGFSAVALIGLALGIGSSTAIFTVIDVLMLRSLPVVEPQELVRVTTSGTGIDTDRFTNPQWEALRDREDVFNGVFATSTTDFQVGDDAADEQVGGALVSGAFFQTLGLGAETGRLIGVADDRRGCDAVVVLGNGYWRRRFGGDEDVVGSTVLLDGHPFEVVGVLEAGFSGMYVDWATHLYVPLCADAVLRGERSPLDHRRTWWLSVVGRRPTDVPIERLSGELAALAPVVLEDAVPDRWDPDRLADYLDGTLEARPAPNGFSLLRGRYRSMLLLLLAGVGVVMLVVCGNLANLLLARAARRRHEIAMRVALGAGRGRLLFQSLSESLLLAGLGALAGVVVAHWASRALVTFITPPDLALTVDLPLDLRVLGFTAAVAVVTGVLFGMAPALRASRIDPQVAISGGRHGAAPPPLFGGGTLVVAQVSLSLVLVTGAALLVGTFWRLETLDPGFDRDGVMLVDVDISDLGLQAEPRRQRLLELADRLRVIPGVRAASYAEMAPVSGNYVTELVVPSGFESLLDDDVEVFAHRVGEGYFASMGTAVLRGRDFDSTDVRGSEPVAVLSESAARLLFGDLDVVGRTFQRRLGDTEVGEPIRVIGVVRDAKYRSLRDEQTATVYFALRQQPYSWYGELTFHVLRDPDVPVLPNAVRAAVEQIVPRAHVDIELLSEHLSASLASERLLATISGFFGSLALFLAVIGLYGVMSFDVSRRFREIGVRLALGSTERGVFGLVLRQAARPVAVGLMLGTLFSLAATRTVASLLYGIGPRDVRVLALSAAVLALAALGSVALPARRAARLDPVEVLRRDA